MPPSKLAKILHEVKQVLSKTNKNYGLVIKAMYKYYDMKLVMFGIDQDRNMIIQFPGFVQPYTQKPLTLYQIETIPVLILDMNKRADSYTWIRIGKPYNFLLEPIAACDPDSTDVDLEMYFVANTAFLNYFKGLIDMLEC